MIELVLKLIGLGWKKYTQDRFNIFDALIAILSLAELIISRFFDKAMISTIKLLLAMRALRLLKLGRYSQDMRKVLDLTMKSLVSIGSFSILLLIFIVVWGLLGMELFSYHAIMDEEGNLISSSKAMDMLESGEISMIDYPRENFNDIGQSLLTTFILINGEDWNHIMNQLINIFKVS